MTPPGPKGIENRSWKPNPKHIGRYIALHGGATFDLASTDTMRRLGFEPLPQGECDLRHKGKIVCIAKLAKVTRLSEDRWYFGPGSDAEKNYGWVLEDRIALPTPVGPYTGARGLWPLSGAAVLEIQRQLTSIGRGPDTFPSWPTHMGPRPEWSRWMEIDR